jgi:hypothetical protein
METMSKRRASSRLSQNLGHEPAYQLPVVLAVLGDAEEALAELDRAVEALGSRRDEAAEAYRRFADAFRHRGLN